MLILLFSTLIQTNTLALILSALLFIAFAVNSKRVSRRYGSVIKLHPEKIEEYKVLHAKAWPGVLEQINRSNIRNYSIYLSELTPGDHYLFSYFEYVGDDFDADMKAMADDPTTVEWWKLTDPMQIPLDGRKEGEWWMNMEEVFHTD